MTRIWVWLLPKDDIDDDEDDIKKREKQKKEKESQLPSGQWQGREGERKFPN